MGIPLEAWGRANWLLCDWVGSGSAVMEGEYSLLLENFCWRILMQDVEDIFTKRKIVEISNYCRN